MNKKNLVVLITVLFVISSIGQISLAERTENPEPFNMSITFQEPIFEIVELNKIAFTLIQIPETEYTNDIGKARLPAKHYMVEIPQNSNPVITIKNAEWELISLDEYELPNKIVPIQPPVQKDKPVENDFVMDYEYYEQDEFTYTETAHIIEIGRIRGHRFALVEINPVSYNPASGELKIMKFCDFIIEFPGSDMDATADILNRYQSTSFNEMSEALFINNNFDDDLLKDTRTQEGYLIIVYDDFSDEIQPLATWKQNKGFDVTVTTTSSIPGGPSKENIYNYIEDAYYNWAIPPSYVLLVGDISQVPTYTGTEGPAAVDLYYVTVEGNDYFPDIHIGRFPAATESDVTAMVDKTIFYEQRNFNNNEWIKKAVFMAGNDNYQITEGTHNYVISNYLIPNNYTVDKLYEVTYGATTQDVTNSLNDGRSLAIFSGHGSQTSWGDGPAFSQSNVGSLTNNGMYPFVCSHSCLTGSFQISECFGETWLREANKAGLAFWGASESTYWDEDDVLEKKMFYAWWVDNIETIGGMTDQALYYLYQHYSGGGLTKYYFEAYNILGDPSIKIWRTMYEHDVSVASLDVGDQVAHGETIYVSGSISNNGLNDESNLIVNFTIDGIVLDSTSISSLQVGNYEQVTFTWNPDYGTYVVGIEVSTVQYENHTDNNYLNKSVDVISAPDIFINPQNFDFFVDSGDADTQILTVGNENTAEGQLYFNISATSGNSWLSVNPTSGGVLVGNTLDLDVTVDATGLSEGQYFGMLILVCNDLDEPTIDIPITMYVTYANDVGVTAINNPTDVDYAGATVVNATVFNFGSAAQTNVPVKCTIYEGILEYYEDFELSNGGFTHAVGPGPGYNDDWEWGAPTSGPSSAHSGNNGWATNLDGDHSNYADGVLDSISIDLSLYPSPELRFWHWYDHTTYDCGNVKISTDGGSTWNIIYPDGGYPGTATTGNQGIPGEPAFTDVSSGWEEAVFDLSAYSSDTVIFRWHFGSTSGTTHPGWYIDDIKIKSSLVPFDVGDIIYEETEYVDVTAYTSQYVEFTPAWNAPMGNHTIQITTLLNGDEDNSNNQTATTVEILPSQQMSVNLDLSTGWNHICIPVENNYTASTLGENISGCTVVSKWNAQGGYFQSFLVGISPPASDFAIENGVSYFVYTGTSSVFLVTGDSISSVSVDLYTGWNMLGWCQEIPTTATDVGDSINGCDVVSKWNAEYQYFNSFLVGISPPASNFNVNCGNGLFVYVDQPSTWNGLV